MCYKRAGRLKEFCDDVYQLGFNKSFKKIVTKFSNVKYEEPKLLDCYEQYQNTLGSNIQVLDIQEQKLL